MDSERHDSDGAEGGETDSRHPLPPRYPLSTTHHPLLRAAIEYAAMAGVLAALILYFGLTTKSFLTRENFTMLASRNLPGPTVLAVGMTFVLIIGGIDLSVGSVLGLSSVVMGVLLAGGEAGLDWPLWSGVAACLAVGLLAGGVNGLVTVGWSIPSFIVTLGMLEVARGLAYLVAQSRTAYIGSKVLVLSQASVVGVSLPFLLAIAVVVLGQFVISRTIFGRNLVALGCNEEAVRLSGIRPRPIRVAVFMLCGLLAALAAVIEVSKQGAANPNAGSGYELEAIAAVVVGGTSLMGGRGSVIGSFFGVMIMTVLSSGLAASNVAEDHKRIVTGAVIVVAVILDRYRSRLST